MNKTILGIFLVITLGIGAFILFGLPKLSEVKKQEQAKKMRQQALLYKKKNYSKRFYEYFDSLGVSLKSDSLMFSNNKADSIVKIPQLLPDKRFTAFASGKARPTLLLKQKNYSDIEFKIIAGNKRFQGLATLMPSFHAVTGMKTLKKDDAIYPLYEYQVVKSNNKCLQSILLGNVSQDTSVQRLVSTLVIDSLQCIASNDLTGLANVELKEQP